jgi:uncharacterized membrane protein YfhO
MTLDGMTGKTQRAKDVLLIFLLITSVPIFFGHVIASGKPLFGSDFLFYFYPLKKFIYDYFVTHGTVPLWNVHQFSGTPLIGNIQAAMFYPLGFLFYLIPTQQAYGYTIMLHCALGAIFMYAFARSLSIERSGAFIAAVIFSYNGFFMGHVYAGHLTFVDSYIWIPLIFQCVHKLVNMRRLKYAILAGLALGLQLLGGFPQIAFYTILLIILFVTYHVVVTLKRGTMDIALKFAYGMVIILLSGFSLAAIQVFPTYEFAHLSSRSGGITYEFATIDSFDPLNFVTFLVPGFFGNPVNNTYWKSTEVCQFWELGAYAGVGPLLLLGFLRKNARTRHVRRFFVLALFLSLFLSLGKYNPLYRLIYYLPGFNHFRIPAQILYLYVFSLSILAGMGLGGVTKLESYPTSYKIILGLGIFFFAGLVAMLLFEPPLFFSYVFKLIERPEFSPPLMARLHAILKVSLFTGAGFFVVTAGLIHLIHKRLARHSLAIAIFLAVMTLDLWTFANALIKTTDLSLDQKKMALLSDLNSDLEIRRIAVMNDSRLPNDGLVYRYQDIQGYDPLILKRYLSYINRSQNTLRCSEAVNVGHVRDLDNHLIRMLNVKYAISNKTALLQAHNSLPRAYIVHKAITVSSGKVLDFMMTDDFNPQEAVVFEDLQQQKAFSWSPRAAFGLEENGSPECSMTDGTEYCRVKAYKNEEIALSATMNHDGYLVLSEINYPGWVAYVNGRKRPLLTGNYIFRVLPLPKGNHDIVIRFEPRSFKVGMIITAVTIFFVALFQISALVRNRLG